MPKTKCVVFIKRQTTILKPLTVEYKKTAPIKTISNNTHIPLTIT